MKNAKILAGDIFKTNEGGSVEVVCIEGCYKIHVQHKEHGSHISTVTSGQLRSGRIKNPYKPRIHGIGFVGSGNHRPSLNGRDTRAYVSWSKMLQRCYSKTSIEDTPSYNGCYVVDEWHNFQSFAEWYQDQPFSGDGYQLDKDILKKGNREYGPRFCRLVPCKINKILNGTDAKRGDFPIGVNFFDGKYCAHCSTDGKKNYIGRFNSEHEAFNAYKIFREAYIKRCANDHREMMTHDIYEALMAREIEITD